MSDDLVREAERQVIEAAEEWELEQRQSPRPVTSSVSQKLRVAVYMLRRARVVTGKVRAADRAAKDKK